MDIPFVDRNPSANEVERLRLILSTYQDGSGQQSITGGRTLPGWRDFKRAVALSWNRAGQYQLFKFAIQLPEPESIDWDFPIITDIYGVKEPGRRLRGRDGPNTTFEWYGESGGQLKYYPLVENSLWKSDIFYLEPLPEDWAVRHGILMKARDYFPKQWAAIY